MGRHTMKKFMKHQTLSNSGVSLFDPTVEDLAVAMYQQPIIAGMAGGWEMHGMQSFHNLEFHKRGNEIAYQALKKIKFLKGKIKERQGRVEKICKQHGLTAADFFGNVDEFVNVTSNSYQIQAGEQSQLRTESTLIQQEKQELKNIELLARNIDKKRKHKLTFAELEYLEF